MDAGITVSIVVQTCMQEYALYIGIAAGICTAISLLHQLIKIIREKKAENISFLMLFTLLVGVSGWIWYGLLKQDWPIIATNSFSLLVNLLIIYFTFKHKK